MISNLLMKDIEINAPDDKVAVLLSGGVDSLSVAFAAQRQPLNKEIHAYSFRLDTHESYDFKKAKEISELFGWEFTGVVIDTSTLETDFHKLTSMGCKKKSAYECTYPFLHIYPQIKEKYVLSGWAADGYYGLSKTARIHYKETKEKFDEFRDAYFAPHMRANYVWHKKVADMHNKVFVTPYLSDDVKDYFYAMDWDEINKPGQKHHVRTAFEEEFNKSGRVSPHKNLQIDSKTNKLFERFLDNDMNFKERIRVLDICRDWHDFAEAYKKIKHKKDNVLEILKEHYDE